MNFTNFVIGDDSYASESESSSNENILPNQRKIELWGRSPGLLESETSVTFLGSLCNVSIHFL